MPVQLVLDLFTPAAPPRVDARPGRVANRDDVPAAAAYAVFDCETTGTRPADDEIVSLALIRLDGDGVETARYTQLLRPSRAIPAEATAIHGIADVDVAEAPRFPEIAGELRELLDGAVFVAHNVGFDLPMLRQAFARAGISYSPSAVACTLEAFRLLEPRADNHRLQTLCEGRGIELGGAHEALSDVLATVGLLRVLLADGFAPETVELDHGAYMRLRARGDTRPASEPQIRRLFAIARTAGFVATDGSVDRDRILELVQHVTGVVDVEALTRAQVQDVYDVLEDMSDRPDELATAV